ncbi:MAG: response regulator, partial [Spirochaetes bacterium]|nr:response regulator [Spirochaetota bacterium]
MKILIAEDDAVSRRVLETRLEKWGHQVVITKDGAEAWNVFKDEEFSMVITDWMMPEL